MNVAEQDYRIWKNKNFIVEATIDFSLWNKNIITNFQKNLTKTLDEIYLKSDLNTLNTKYLISLFFSGDKKMIELNNYYRKINASTNVLSFPNSSNSKNEFFLGDIILSLETIYKEATRDNKNINNHLIHLFIHGVLHLLGYDHETEEEAKKMENIEIKILRKLQVDNPY